MMKGVLGITRSSNMTRMQEVTAGIWLHFLYTIFSILLFINGVTHAQLTETTALLGGTATFQCTITKDQVAQWRDVDAGGNVLLFTISAGTVTRVVGTSPKYAEYRILHNTDTQFDLEIQSVNISDVGNFRCVDVIEDPIAEASLDVNALPHQPVTIECIAVPAIECPTTGSSSSSSEFLCTCTATGVYPERLEFTWENVDNPSQQTKTPQGDLFDINATATVRPSSGDDVKCSLTGYTNEEAQQSPAIEKSTQFASPTCTLVVPEITDTTVCSAVPLTCECDESNDGSEYSFYNGNEVIGGLSNELTVNITQYRDSPNYYCRLCNGIYYGEESIGRREIYCPPMSTTAPPTTEPPTTPEATDTPGTTGDPPTTEGSSTSAIIFGSIGGVVVLICLVAFLVWFFKYREGNDDHTATNPSKTKSAPPPDNKDPEIPAYGVVNKPKKTPEPAPRGNTMELQYADLDHGNAPPSNQIRMPEEPTEYATVQSVVV